MPKYNQILMGRYRDIASLSRKISKQHLNFDPAWNHLPSTLLGQMIPSQDVKEELFNNL